jgi:pimeloyl-ACP methyl ester carboxylesterase
MLLPYDEAGEGDAVVLLHAGIADRTMWREHLQPLAAAGYRVLAIDLPGFGAASPTDLHMPWVDVLETMDTAGVECATLVGNSLGGAVALRVAVVAPERVRALMLISAPDVGIETSPSPEILAAWEAEEAALERNDVEAAVAAVVGAWTLPDAPLELRERIAAMQRRAFAWQSSAPPPTETPDPLDENPEALGQLDIPALVAVGERDMPGFGDAALRLAEALHPARHVVLAGVGHLAPIEAPDVVRDLLINFLKQPSSGLL